MTTPKSAATSTATTVLDPTRAMDAMSAWAQANERVLGQFVELSAGAALQALRTYGELQAATMESIRGARVAATSPDDALQGPMNWYVGGLKLIETQAQIVARGNERLQESAERAGRDIRDAVETCAGRMKEIYSAG